MYFNAFGMGRIEKSSNGIPCFKGFIGREDGASRIICFPCRRIYREKDDLHPGFIQLINQRFHFVGTGEGQVRVEPYCTGIQVISIYKGCLYTKIVCDRKKIKSQDESKYNERNSLFAISLAVASQLLSPQLLTQLLVSHDRILQKKPAA